MSALRYFYVQEFDRVVRLQGDCAWAWKDGEWQRCDAWAEVIGVGTDASASDEITENEAVRRGAGVFHEHIDRAPQRRTTERSDPSDVEILSVHEGGGLVRYRDNTADEEPAVGPNPQREQRCPKPLSASGSVVTPATCPDVDLERARAPQERRNPARNQKGVVPGDGMRALSARRYRAHLLASLITTCGMLVIVLLAPAALPRPAMLALIVGAGLYYVGAFLMAAAFVWRWRWALAAMLFVGLANRSGALAILGGIVPLVLLLWRLTVIGRAGGRGGGRTSRLARDLRLVDVLSKKSVVDVTSCEERAAVLELLPALTAGMTNDDAVRTRERLASLIQRGEKTVSTSRDGIAVVTVMTRDATPLLAAIGRSGRGVRLREGGAAHLLFVTTELPEHADREWNARLMWVLTRPGVRAQLREARSPRQLLRILGRDERRWPLNS